MGKYLLEIEGFKNFFLGNPVKHSEYHRTFICNDKRFYTHQKDFLIISKICNNPARISNVDYTVITNVEFQHFNVNSLKGKQQNDAITPAESSSLVTMLTYISSAGGYVPAMLVFPRENMKAERWCATGNHSRMPSIRVDTTTFICWRASKKHTKPSAYRKQNYQRKN